MMSEFKIPIVPPKIPIKLPENEEKFESNVSQDSKSVAQNNLVTTLTECPYIEPEWSVKPFDQQEEYSLEVLKSGIILEKIKNLQRKSHWTIGRLEQNDIMMAHPTISRFHAVLQYRLHAENASDKSDNKSTSNKSDTESTDNVMEITPNSKIGGAWYIYDLGSTHGTFLNKKRIPSKLYIRMRVGHMFKFGCSTRTYILQGPDIDEEPDSYKLIPQKPGLYRTVKDVNAEEKELEEEQREREGISWGMSEDADEATDLSVNPYAITNNEELFLNDPKKTLRGFFEREGLNLDYKCDEMSPGTFVCRIDLPIDDNIGKPIIAEVCHKGKKKDCVVQCALEACRILDRQGILRKSHHEPLKRKTQTADSDDDDDFLDRTGDVEKKKLKKANAGHSKTLTYEDLIKQETDLNLKMIEVEKGIALYQDNAKRIKENKLHIDDDLDNYMENLTKESTSIDKTEIRKLRVEEQQLKGEIEKIKKLIKIAKPVDLPPISSSNKNVTNEKKTVALPLFGKRNKSKFTIKKSLTCTNQTSTKEFKSDEEEYEEDDVETISKDKVKVKVEENASNNTNAETNIETDIIDIKESVAEKDIINMLVNSRFQADKSCNLSQEILKTNNIETEDYLTKHELDEKIKEEIGSDDNILENKIEQIIEFIPKTSNSLEELNVVDKDLTHEKLMQKGIEQDEDNLENDNNQNKKRKHRTRNRNRRENVDIDDYEEFIDAEKHSNWIPPKNQSGDGRTSLNDKFGY